MGFLRRSAKNDEEKAARRDEPTVEQLRNQLAPTNQRQLRYEDAIGWFVDQRPRSGLAVKGAILRAALRDGRTEIVQLFLDAEGQPLADGHGGPCGRRLVVERVDDELSDAFGDTHLLIVD